MIRQLLREGSVYAATAVLTRGLAFLVVPLYSRLLSPADYGALELVATLAVLVTLLVPLEVGQGMAREWSELQDPAAQARLAGTAWTFTLLGYAAFLALLLPLAPRLAPPLFGPGEWSGVLALGALQTAAQALALQAQSPLRWSRRALAYGLLGLLQAALTLGLGLWGCAVAGLPGLLAGQTLAALLSAALALGVSRGLWRLGLDGALLRRMLAFSAPLVPAGAALFLAFHANRWLLAHWGGLTELGPYAVAWRIAALSGLLMLGVQGALTPLIYQQHRDPQVPGQLAALFRVFATLALAVCLVLGLGAPEWMRLADARYAGAAPLLMALAPAALLSQMYVFAPGLTLARRTGAQLALTLASGLLALALNAALIPGWGAQGAAWANLAAALLFFVGWWRVSQRHYPLPVRWAPLARALALALLLAAVGSAAADTLPAPAGALLRWGLCAAFALAAWKMGLLSARAPAPTAP